MGWDVPGCRDGFGDVAATTLPSCIRMSAASDVTYATVRSARETFGRVTLMNGKRFGNRLPSYLLYIIKRGKVSVRTYVRNAGRGQLSSE